MIGGSWFSLTLVSFDQVDLTTVADEHLDGEHIEQVPVRQVGQRKIKIRGRIHLSDHNASVRLGPTVIHDIVAARFVKPSALNLHFDESSSHIEDQIVWQTVSDGLQNPPATLQRMKNGRLL